MLVQQFDVQSAAAHLGQEPSQWPLLNRWPTARVARAALEFIEGGDIQSTLGTKPSSISRASTPLRFLRVRLAMFNGRERAQLRNFLKKQRVTGELHVRASLLDLI